MLSSSLWENDRYRPIYNLKEPLMSPQATHFIFGRASCFGKANSNLFFRVKWRKKGGVLIFLNTVVADRILHGSLNS